MCVHMYVQINHFAATAYTQKNCYQTKQFIGEMQLLLECSVAYV